MPLTANVSISSLKILASMMTPLPMTLTQLSLKIPDREHKAIVQKVISRKPEQALNEQEHKYSKDYQPPIKQKSR